MTAEQPWLPAPGTLPAAALAPAALGPAALAPPGLAPADGLAQLSFLVHGLLERQAREHDVSMSQTRLLGVLRDRRPTMNELASFLDLDKSSVTGLVDRAERRGLVERIPSATDRRAIQVALTATGRHLVSDAAARFEADVTALLGRLPPADRDALAGLISRLLVAHAAARGVNLLAATGPQAGPAWPGS